MTDYKSFIDILSQPWALLGSKVFIIANISFSVTWMAAVGALMGLSDW